ncbi:MAG: DUF2281 domain-containing protein [Xenococcaceae cyanobacterium]
MNAKTKYDFSQEKSLRDRAIEKLNNLSTEELNLVCQFVEFLEYRQHSIDIDIKDLKNPTTNEEIDKIVETYRQQNKLLPIGLAKGEFVVPDDFNEPLPDDILDLFEPK